MICHVTISYKYKEVEIRCKNNARTNVYEKILTKMHLCDILEQRCTKI